MANKAKKKSVPRKVSKPKSRRRLTKVAPGMMAPVLTPSPAPSSNGRLLAILILGVLGFSWLGIRVCSRPKNIPAMPVIVSPEARSVAPVAVPQKIEAPKVQTNAHRETAGAKAAQPKEVGAPGLTFDRTQSKTFEVRCWRSNDAPAQLDIFAPRNRLVKSLKSDVGPAGSIKLNWDGRDAVGKKVPEGLYFLRPTQDGDQSIREIWVKG